MASGSTAPFSGEFSELENVPTLGMTDDQRQSLNELFQATARNQFDNNLTELNYDGGLLTIYRNLSKIKSSSDVNISTLSGVGSKGTVELGSKLSGNVVNIDDGSIQFTESGSNKKGLVINPNSDLAGVKVTALSKVSGGTRAQIINFDNNTVVAEKTNLNVSGGDTIKFSVGLSQGTNYGIVLGGSGSSITHSRINDNAGHDGDLSTVSSSHTNFDIKDAVDMAFNSTSFSGSLGDSDNWADLEALKFGSSGSITSVSKDLSLQENAGFTSPPSSAVVSQSADVPTNTSLTYTLRDGNGNTVTVTQSDVDTVIDTSNFTSTTVELEINLSQSRTNNDQTPTSKDVMVHFKQ